MTWAEENYDLQRDIEWTLGNMRRLRQKIRAGRFGSTFSELIVTVSCAGEFTRSDVLRRRCLAAVAEAERALEARYA